MHPNEHTNNTLKARELSTPDDTYTTEETINQLKALTEKLCLVKDRITIDHAIIEIRSAANEIDILRVWCKGVEADNTTYRNLYNATLQQRDEAKRLLKAVVDITLEGMAPNATHPKHPCDFVHRPHIAICKMCEDWAKALAAIYPDDFKDEEDGK